MPMCAGWTVAELAKLAGMSRSAFAARFNDTLGCAPMEYLSRWRIALAQDALSRGGKSLDRVADEIGYRAASAFSTAFRKRVGCSPGAFAGSGEYRRGAVQIVLRALLFETMLSMPSQKARMGTLECVLWPKCVASCINKCPDALGIVGLT